MNKAKLIARPIITTVICIIAIYLISIGVVNVKVSDRAAMQVILGIIPFFSILNSIKSWKKPKITRDTSNISTNDYKSLTDSKVSSKDLLLYKVTIQIVILILAMIGLFVLEYILIESHFDFSFLSNIFSIIIMILFTMIILVIMKYLKENTSYINLDEYLFNKYNLEECLNKREKLADLSKEIELLRSELKSLSQNREANRELVSAKEIEIDNLINEISVLREKNKYKKILPNGSCLYFEFVIHSEFLRVHTKKRRVYDIIATLSVEPSNLKEREEWLKISNGQKHVKAIAHSSGVIETELREKLMNKDIDLLASYVSHSYEACIEFINF